MKALTFLTAAYIIYSIFKVDLSMLSSNPPELIISIDESDGGDPTPLPPEPPPPPPPD